MKRIIIVEDDIAILEAMGIGLCSAGYLVTTFLDGREILENDFTPPDIFILDRHLPGINGLDLCRHLKANAATGHIPVIMMSASQEILVLAKDASADDALEKPFKMKYLRDMMAKHLGVS